MQSANEKLGDETMSAFKPRTTKTANLPHLSSIKRKPEPLGTELKSLACSVTKIMLALEIQRRKNDTTQQKYVDKVKLKTSACTLRMVEAACQRTEETNCDVTNDDATEDCFVGDSWFGSVPTALGLKKELQHPKASITQIKTAHSRYPKKYLETTMKNWPGGSHLVLESTIDGTKLFAVGYKYCKAKTLCFLFTEGATSTEMGDPYVAKWKDEHGNSMWREVPRPECCTRYFQNSNIIDVLNQQRQKELRLEKYWVTQDGFFRVTVTVFGIVVVDVWNGYKYHLGNGHRHKDCELMDLVNMLAFDLINNNMSKEWIVDEESELTIMEPGTISTIEFASSPGDSAVSDITGLAGVKGPFLELLVLSHDLVETDESTEERRRRTNKETGRVTIRVEKRKKRFVCVKCKSEKRDKRTKYHCKACPAPSKCKRYWLCKDCLPGHREDVRKNANLN